MLEAKDQGHKRKCSLKEKGLQQYLNCKILHGGTLLQPWPNFSGNYVIPSPQLKGFFPETRWRQKKGLCRKLKYFFPEIKRKPKKKEKRKRLHRNLGLYSAGICRIYSCCLALDRSIIRRSSLDGWTSKFQWGTLNLDGETLTLNGGRIPPRPSYNLSTGLQKKFLTISRKNRFPKNFSCIPQTFNNSINSAVLEPRTGQFSKTWGFEAKDIKMCPRGQGLPLGLHLWPIIPL